MTPGPILLVDENHEMWLKSQERAKEVELDFIRDRVVINVTTTTSISFYNNNSLGTIE